MKTKMPHVFCIATVPLLLVGPASAADLHVPTDHASIQAAVDAAGSGDTIHIAAGVYLEQIRIDGKDLALVGRPGAVLRAFPGMIQMFPDLFGYGMGILSVHRADVLVSGLTFEGERLGDNSSLDLGGVYLFGASGRIEDCRFSGFRGSTVGANVYCPGVAAYNAVSYGTGVVDIRVLRCTFADNARCIELTGDFRAPGQPTADNSMFRVSFAVNDNTIMGSGPDGTGEQIGVRIGSGMSGELKRNTITDFSYPSDSPANPSIGLLCLDPTSQSEGKPVVALLPVHIEANVFRNNQLHCGLVRADNGVVANNAFEGTAPGSAPAGLRISGTDTLVVSNRFSDMELGIHLIDDSFGPYGTTSNAMLAANGFCNVVTEYLYEPAATYTVEDTRTCPWPALDIQAVQLSWPYAFDGYSLEAAPAADGPWSPLSTTPTLQDGQRGVVVPSNSARQFFRLAKP